MRKIIIATLVVAAAAAFLGEPSGQSNASEPKQVVNTSPMELMSTASGLPVQSFGAI